MQAEVVFDCSGYGSFSWMIESSITSGAAQIVASSLVLGMLSPSIRRQLARFSAGSLPSDLIGITEAVESPYLAATGAAIVLGAVSLMPASAPNPSDWSCGGGPVGILAELANFAALFRWGLVGAALVGGATMAARTLQLSMRQRFQIGVSTFSILLAILGLTTMLLKTTPIPLIVGWPAVGTAALVLCSTSADPVWSAVRCIAYPIAGLVGFGGSIVLLFGAVDAVTSIANCCFPK